MIGHLLFGEANVFVEDRQCVTLEPMKGESADIFECGDMKGIRDVELCEVHFVELASPGRTVMWKQDGHDGIALSRATYVQFEDGVRVPYENHVLPPSKDSDFTVICERCGGSFFVLLCPSGTA